MYVRYIQARVERMAFTITARLDGQLVWQTRTYVSSAVVLGKKWADAGYQAVSISNNDGPAYELADVERRGFKQHPLCSPKRRKFRRQ